MNFLTKLITVLQIKIHLILKRMGHSTNRHNFFLLNLYPLIEQLIGKNISALQKIVVHFERTQSLCQITRQEMNLVFRIIIKEIFIVRPAAFFYRVDLIYHTVNSGKQHGYQTEVRICGCIRWAVLKSGIKIMSLFSTFLNP